MQRVEMEELRQREANLTALNAIGPRKKPKIEPGLSPSLQVNINVKHLYPICKLMIWLIRLELSQELQIIHILKMISIVLMCISRN